jgi:hypothetical protein
LSFLLFIAFVHHTFFKTLSLFLEIAYTL